MIKCNNKAKVLISILTIFLICMFIRVIEYWFIRTDQTVIAENFIHKLFGIMIMCICVKLFSLTLADIGFSKNNILKQTFLGVTMGLVFFGLAYLTEILILVLSGNNTTLEIYVSGFSFVGLPIKNTAIEFFILCFLFNMINVIMEEGIFRGLFLKIGENAFSFVKLSVLIAVLFGVWHFILPLRSYTDGDMSLYSMIFMNVGYLVLGGIMSMKWLLLYKITGSLWFSMGDHFVNNTLTNILHVTTPTGSDELQIVRIIIAQLLSFSLVISWYFKNKKTFRNLISNEVHTSTENQTNNN